MKATPSAEGPVLVTGATGFLGGAIVRRLVAQGRQVSVLARRDVPALEAMGVTVHRGSLSDRKALDDAFKWQKTIFHVAAKVGVWGKTSEFHETNVVGTRNVLAAARDAGVRRFVYTSTPSVVYNGKDLAGVDESMPLTTSCPSPYPLTKAIAERLVLSENSSSFRTTALRPHLIWGIGDPHLVPRLLARAHRLRIVGSGRNRVDMVHIDNAVDAHLLAEIALGGPAAGKAYFITNGEPVLLWDWINGLFRGVGKPQVRKTLSLRTASSLGAVLEALWTVLPLSGEPPMTRFVASELAKDHWFSIEAARRDLGYEPKVSMEEGTRALVAALSAPRAGARPRTG